MILHLATSLEVPLRERNGLLLAAGLAPAYTETSLDAPEMAPVREALEQLLAAHEPFPAVVVDRHWNLVLANTSVLTLVTDIDDGLLRPPINVLRATLHPGGLAPLIVNFDEYASHLIDRLRRQISLTGDPELEELFRELLAYPRVRAGLSGAGHGAGGAGAVAADAGAADAGAAAGAGHVLPSDVVLPIRIRNGSEVLSFFTMVSTLGTALDVTLADLAVESFFPADELTGRLVRERAAASG